MPFSAGESGPAPLIEGRYSALAISIGWAVILCSQVEGVGRVFDITVRSIKTIFRL
ncbi:MAG: hypothetical protein ACLVHV_02590 [Oscillospiraceae bacterium]